jgi:ferredoxin-type protein NapH
MKLRRARTLVSLAGLALIAAGTMAVLSFGNLCCWRLGWVRFMCPIGFIEVSLAGRTIYWHLVGPFLAVLGLVVLLGRAFCSWLCPSNLVVSGLIGLSGRLSSLPAFKWTARLHDLLARRLPIFDYRDGLALLAGSLAGIALFGYPFLTTFCPIGVITRNVISLFTHFRLGTDLFLLLLPLAAVYLFSFGCISGCPLGSLQRLLSVLSILRPIKETQHCTSCEVCTKNCPAHLDPGAGYDIAACTKCFLCKETCPEKAITVHFGPGPGKRSRNHSKTSTGNHRRLP